MELLVILLIVLFISVSGNKKKGATAAKGAAISRSAALAKKAALARETEPAEGKEKPRASLWPKIDIKQDDVVRMLSDWVDEAAGAKAAIPTETRETEETEEPHEARPVQVPGQKSPVFMAARGPLPASILDEEDEEGCVGGSMAHTHEEGESRTEHAHHLREAQNREAQETLAASAAAELREMNLSRLRQAVVMAEILDRPRALRPGRGNPARS